MRLNEKQIRFFHTFGFLVFRDALAPEIQEITNRFEKIWRHAQDSHDKKQRSTLVPFIDQDEYLSAMIDHEMLDGIASSLLGDDYNYTGSDGNYYVGDTLWHSDGWFRTKYLSIKMAIYLDPVTSDTGCLRVIPGSHHVGAFADMIHGAYDIPHQEQERLWGIKGIDIPSLHIESKPGDLVVFAHRIRHSSFGGGDARRMFTINFEKRHLEEDIDLIKKEISSLAVFWAERAYGKKMIDTAGLSRMKHLEQRLANDGHLPGLVSKDKAETSNQNDIKLFRNEN